MNKYTKGDLVMNQYGDKGTVIAVGPIKTKISFNGRTSEWYSIHVGDSVKPYDEGTAERLRKAWAEEQEIIRKHEALATQEASTIRSFRANEFNQA